jgi:hypothetical protein
MTDLASLSELLKRVEEATGADRRVDSLIYALIFFPAGRAVRAGLPEKAPAYTASLDAVIALVEEVLPEWWWGVKRHFYAPRDGDGIFEGLVFSHDSECERCVRGYKETPALALVAALLRAKMAEGKP